MKNSVRRILAILLGMIMIFDIIPLASMAEQGKTIEDTGALGGTFQDSFAKSRGTNISVKVQGTAPEFSNNSYNYFVVAFSSTGAVYAAAEIDQGKDLDFSYKSGASTLSDDSIYKIFYGICDSAENLVNGLNHTVNPTVLLSESGKAGDYLFTWSNTPENNTVTIFIQPQSTKAVVKFVDDEGNSISDANQLGKLNNKTLLVFRQNLNGQDCFSANAIEPSTADQEFYVGTTWAYNNYNNATYDYKKELLIEIYTLGQYDNVGNALQNGIHLKKNDVTGDYILDDITYDTSATTFVFKKRPPRTVHIAYYEKDGNTITGSPSIPDGFYLVAKYDNNWKAYAPINTDGTVGTFKDNSNNEIELPAVQEFKITKSESTDSTNILNGQACDLSVYGLTYPDPLETDSDNIYQITATEKDNFKVKIVFSSGSQTYTLSAEEAAELNAAGYYLFLSIPGQYENNGTLEDLYYVNTVSLNNTFKAGTSEANYSITSFNMGNTGDPKPYSSDKTVSTFVTKGSPDYETNTGSTYKRGELKTTDNVLQVGDPLGTKFAISEITRGTDEIIITATKVNPYSYTVSTNDTSFKFDDSNNWYLLSTLEKTNGGTFYSVVPLSWPETGTSFTGNISNYFNNTDLGNVSISSPNDHNATMSSLYVAGDTVTNSLVHCSEPATNYKQIINGYPSYENKQRDLYVNGNLANKYIVNSTDENGAGSIVLNRVQNLSMEQQYKDSGNTLQTPDSIDSGAKGYKLLVTMTDNSGKKSYALKELSVTGNPTDETDIEVFRALNGDGTLNDNEKRYYSGNESLVVEVVSGEISATKIGDIINGTANGVVKFSEGEVTTELYRFSSTVVPGSQEHPKPKITTTFTKIANNPVPHTINIQFYDKKNGDELSALSMALNTDDKYYFRIRLLDEKQKTVAYKIIEASDFASTVNATGKFKLTLDTGTSFTLVDKNGNNLNATVHYDPSEYPTDLTDPSAEKKGIDVRLYRLKDNTQSIPTNLADATNKGTDLIEGYDFWTNTYKITSTDSNNAVTADETNIRLYSAYKKIYQTKIIVQDGATIADGDEIKIYSYADHATTKQDKYENVAISAGTATDENGKTYTFVIEDQTGDQIIRNWTNKDENPNNTISGNEKFSTYIVQNGKEIKEQYPVILSGSVGKDYKVHYVLDEEPVIDDNTKITTITQYVYIQPVIYDRAINPYSVLGDGAEYGVIADKYIRHDHTETNFAVNTYDVQTGAGIDVDASGGGRIPFYVGNILNGKIKFASSNTSEPDVFMSNTLAPARDYIHQDSNSYQVNVIYKDPTEISSKVSGLIDKLKHSSDVYRNKPMITPTKMANGKPESIDTRMFPDNVTLYIDGSDFIDYFGITGWEIHKLPGQTIVFNIPGDKVKISKEIVYVYNTPDDTNPKTIDANTGGNGGDAAHNKDIEDCILNHIVFNAFEASELEVHSGPAGLFLAPRDGAYVVERSGSGTGWIATAGTFDQISSEWHFFRTQRRYTGTETGYTASKFMTLSGGSLGPHDPSTVQTFSFVIEQLNRINGSWEKKAEATNDGSSVDFPKIDFADAREAGEHYFRITESDGTDRTQYIIRADVSLDPENYTLQNIDTYWKLSDDALNASDLTESYTANKYKLNDMGNPIPKSAGGGFETEEETRYRIKGIYLISATETADGKLGSNQTSADVVKFINEYTSRTSYQPRITKDLTENGISLNDGTKWPIDGFEFTISEPVNNTNPQGGSELPARKTAIATVTAKNAAFDAITFTKTGIYTFEITETVPNGADSNKTLNHITYNDTPVTVAIDIQEDATTHELYVYSVKYGDASSAVTGNGISSAAGSVINTYGEEQTGSLKLRKVVQVNHTAPTDANKSLVKGNYVFTIASTTLDPQVTKTITVTFGENGTITGVTQDSNVSLNDATGEITVSGLKVDSYTITETLPTNGTSLIGATVTAGSVNAANVATVNVTAGNAATAPVATFTNNIDTGILSLTKTVIGTTDNETGFSFEIVLTPPSGVQLANSYPATHTGNAAITSVPVTTVGNARKITGIILKHNETLTISGLPANTTYVITEANPTGGFSIGTQTNMNGTIPANNQSGTTYSIATIAATQVNTYAAQTGSLKITKAVKKNGNTDNTLSGEYTFMVNGPASAAAADRITKYVRINVTGGQPTQYKVADTETGLSTTEYRSGGTALVSGLAAGNYTVTELPAGAMTLASIVRGDSTNGDTNNRSVTLNVTAGENDPANTSAAFVTFTNNKETTQIRGTKTWIDKRQHNNGNEVTLTLKRTTKPVTDKSVWDTVTVSNTTTEQLAWNDGSYLFSNLEKYNASHVEYEYKVEETAVNVMEGNTAVPYKQETTADSNAQNGYHFVNTELTTVTARKTWNGVNNNWLTGMTVTFELKQNGNSITQNALGQAISTQQISDKDGMVSWANLPKYYKNGNTVTAYEYTVTETEVKYNNTLISNFRDVFTVTGEANKTGTVVIDNTMKTTNRSVTKTWVDGQDTSKRPNSITYTLSAVDSDNAGVTLPEYGVTAEKTGLKDNNYQVSWDKLPEYTYAGKAITYSISEGTVPNYMQIGTATYTESTRTWNFQNKELGKVKVTKVVTGGVNLPANFQITAQYNDKNGTAQNKTLKVTGGDISATGSGTAANPYSWEIGDLLLGTTVTFTEQNNRVYGYDVNTTVTDSAGNRTAMTGNATVVNGSISSVAFVNAYTEKKTNVSVEKVWSDGNDKHESDSITINLLKNGNAVPGQSITLPQIVGGKKVWTYSWTNLDAEDKNNGNEITYSVAEAATNGKITAKNGFVYDAGLAAGGKDATTGNYSYTITNTKGGETTVSVRKAWFTTNSGTTEVAWPDGVTVEVTLYRNNTAYDAVKELSSGATAVWTGLPEKDESGNLYNYTVAETKVKIKKPGASTATELTNFKDLFGGIVTGTNNVYTVNNTIKTRDITVEKTWKTAWPNDTKVSVVLKANGIKSTVSDAEAVLTQTNPNKTWSGLPVYDETGKKIDYSVEETSVTIDETVYDSKSKVKLNEMFAITANPVIVGDTGVVKLENEIRTTHVKVNKVWAFAAESNIAQENVTDGTGGKWPKDTVVTVTLYKTVDGHRDQAGVAELSKSKTSYDFTNLPVYDGEKLITYSAEETSASKIELSKFSVSVDKNTSGDVYTITNREKQAGLTITKHVSGKTLTDGEKEKIVFTVMGEGLPATGVTKTLKEMGSGMTWTLTSKDGIIPGKTYTVTESGAAIEDYTKVTKIKANGGAEQNCTDNGNINASANVTVDASTGTGTVDIWNTYTQNVGELEIRKTVEGTNDKTKEFTFEVSLTAPAGITLESNYPAVKTTGAGASDTTVNVTGGKIAVTLKADEKILIKNLPAGTAYTAKETSIPDGYAKKAPTRDAETGTIAKAATSTAAFVNTYNAGTSTSLKATKTLVGRTLKADEFTFELKDADGNVLQTKKNAADGSIVFDEIKYTVADVTRSPITYTISEVKGTDESITYDEHVVTVKVTITDNGDGTLTAAADEAGSNAAFINTYGAKGEIILSANKVLKGRELKAEEFSFELKDADGNVLQTKKNAADGAVIFDAIAYKLEDAAKSPFIYTITEVKGTDPSVIYDEHAEKITVTLTDEGNGTVTAKADKTGTSVQFTNDTYGVKVSKVDVADGKELEGATIQILDKDGKVVEEWISSKEAHEVRGLLTGEEYTLKETVAPEGYCLTAETHFTLDENGKVTSSDTKLSEESILLIEDDRTRIKVQKTDAGTGEELTGATIQILDKDGNIVEEWVSDKDKPHEITLLHVNEEYTLREIVAPEGYLLTTDITFTIDENGKVTASGSTTTDEEGNEIILVEDDRTSVKISKVDVADGRELEGATIQILDKDGKVVEEWVSGKEAHEVRGLLTGEEYTLKETVAPEGYCLTAETHFTINEDGKVTSGDTKLSEENILLIEDDRTRIKVQKTDAGTGEELTGATIQILDKDGNVVEEWVSDKDKPHEITLLHVNEEYTLREIVAPEGYLLTTDITFTIDENGKVTASGSTTTDEEGNEIILVEDDRTSVKVSKVDVADGKELEGATIQILDKEGKVVEEWVSGKEAHEVRGLLTGEEYTLKETVAPEGYCLTAETHFTLDENGKVTSSDTKLSEESILLIEDDRTRIKVQKTDAGTGEELTGATIQILDKDGNVVEEWVSDKDKPHEITLLHVNEEYTLREIVAPEGYLLTTDITFTIDENGKVTASGSTTTDENGEVVLLVEDWPEVTSLSVRKVWNDDNNRDGIRPLNLTVRLKANGEVIATHRLSEDNHWTLTEKGLRKYDGNGDEIEYTWEEIVPAGYTLESTKTTGMLTTLTNTHAAETTGVSVRKEWNDNGNRLGIRPESIRVQLFADGKAEGTAVTLNEANGWTCSWGNLPRYENASGKIGGSREIVYTVTELSVPAGYTMSISGNAAKGFVITNSAESGKLVIRKTFAIETPEKEPEMLDLMDIPVQKIWDDYNNRDGNRPESVTVILLRGGEEIDRATLTAANGWVHIFTGLPKYLNNLTIRYSIAELPVEHYVSSVDGYTITNKYMPTLTSASVRKVWDDNNNKDGMRPASIKMYLNNGMSVTLDESNGWAATINDLPAIVNGKPAEYTWFEERVAGYKQESQEVNGNAAVFTNRLIGTPNPGKAKTGGDRWAIFEEYDTALGGQLLINHVGDCFD